MIATNANGEPLETPVKVGLREFWRHEASGFSTWLAGHLTLLGSAPMRRRR